MKIISVSIANESQYTSLLPDEWADVVGVLANHNMDDATSLHSEHPTVLSTRLLMHPRSI